MVFLTSLVLEDAALAAALAYVAAGHLALRWAFLADFSGIAFGNFILYFAGFGLARWRPDWRGKILLKLDKYLGSGEGQRRRGWTWLIVISRGIPGARSPTYLGAGYFHFPFINYIYLTILSVAGWVALTLLGGKSLIALFLKHWIIATMVLLAVLYLLRKIAVFALNPVAREALIRRCRRSGSR